MCVIVRLVIRLQYFSTMNSEHPPRNFITFCSLGKDSQWKAEVSESKSYREREKERL